ncbi:MAG: GxGYxYP domain-containing protein [Candidatus Helarchaeota archaeon]
MINRKYTYYIIYFSILSIIGILPTFFPISIMDFSHENWDFQDLADNITGDVNYYNNTYYNFSEPSHLNVYDLRNSNYNIQIALTTLQGIVNRENVSLFLIYRDSDLFWLNQLKQLNGINYTFFNSSFLDLITLYNNSISGLVIYDYNFIDTVNVATFLSGINNCISIDENLINNLSSIGITNVKYDLRNSFSSKINLYSWAWNNFNQFATKKMICSLDPEKSYFRDYVVATKMFAFYLSGGPFGPKQEIDLFKYFLSQYPENIPIFGWFTDPGGALGEYESVKILSKFGKYSLCAAIPDLTVFSSIKYSELKQKKNNSSSVNINLENKIYVTVVVSDGDNVNYCSDRLLEYWQDSNRGEVPVGITLEPAMFKLFPTCLDYYYKSANESQYFIAGPSGAGYCYVDLNPSFPKYLNQTKYAMDKADMRQVWLLNGYEGYQLQYSNSIIDAYTSPNLNLTGIYLNYHDFPAELNYVSNNVPIFQSIFVERENEIIGKLMTIKSVSNGPVFVFIGFWAWDFSFTKLKNVVTQLGTDFVFLRPDQFTTLYLESQSILYDRSTNEFNTFLITGLIPIIIISSILVSIYIFYKKKSNFQQNDSFKTILNTTIFFIIDLQFLLILRICLYSTILNIFYFLIFMISITIGIFLKQYLDNWLGSNFNLMSSFAISCVGSLLFYITPQLIFFPGIAIGILLTHQFQSNSSFFNSKIQDNKKKFIYLIVCASIIILLFTPEYYLSLMTFVIIASFSCLIITLIFLFKINTNMMNNVKSKKTHYSTLKNWYPKGIISGFFTILLLSPTFIPERLYYHLFWGINFFPTRLSLSFLVATIYLVCIAILKIFEFHDIKIPNFITYLLAFLSILFYIFIPTFLNGIIIFIITIFLYIFSLLNICIYFFNKFSSIQINAPNNMNINKIKGLAGFTSQFIFWLMVGLFLIFVPPSIIIVDSQEIFSAIGITAISEINWAPIIWYIFYTPSIQVILIIPITIFLLVYGIIFSYF